jgi:uncharacterized repeat protein (TIGR03806 family)
MTRLPSILLAGLFAAPAAPLPTFPPCTTSAVVGSPDPPLPYRPRRVYPNLSPAFPIMARPVPGTNQLLVITEAGPYEATKLVRVPDDPAASDKQAVELFAFPGVAYDLTFHPRFAENGYVYVGWNGNDDAKKTRFTRVTRYTLSPRPPYTFEPKSAATVIEWESNGHNGGAICFGPDGLLYVTSGDGTADSDANNVGQSTDTLLAKVLRIDVDRPAGGKLYSVPADNPFVGDHRFRPETWAYGLRNPWRISCDPATGQLWVGNNGQDQWEQAYLVRKGANYGWSVVEGSHPFHPRTPGPTSFSRPTVEHSHAEARSLTGGVVYRGTKLTELVGAYVYGDYSTGRIWAAKHDGERLIWQKELARTGYKITAIVADRHGELLVLDHQPQGKAGLYTLEPAPNDTPLSPFPRTLSASGLFASVRDHKMAAGVIPYSVNAPFWSDGLSKVRFLALPPGGKIDYTPTRGWELPERTVVVKSFAHRGRWVETRFLTKQGGEWAGYSYRWNAAGTDAVLADAGGADVILPGGQKWRIPSRAECMVCHTRAANYVLGLCELQMNRDHAYPGGPANQLAAFDHNGLFVGQLPPAAERKALVDPADRSKPVEARARSWLHVNCSACHVEAGGGNARMELEFTTAADRMRVIDEKPIHQGFDLADPRLVAPGDPERSVLVKRAATRGPGQMPPLASHRPDPVGVQLLREWIAGLKGTP